MNQSTRYPWITAAKLAEQKPLKTEQAGPPGRHCAKCEKRPALPDRTHCAQCIDGKNASKKEARRKARLANLCLCGEPPRPGFKTCAKCAQRNIDNQRRHIAGKRPGICYRCPATARPGRITCARCAAVGAAANQRRTKERKAATRAVERQHRQPEPGSIRFSIEDRP